MDFQTKSFILKPSSLISVLAFSHDFKTACDRYWIHEGVTRWLLTHFMKNPARAVFLYRMSDIEDSNTQKQKTLTDYCQVVNYLLETYASNDVFAKAEAEIMNYKQAEHQSRVWFSKTFWDKRKDLDGSSINQYSTVCSRKD